MRKTLVLISYRNTLDSVFEDIALRVCNDPSRKQSVFVRYQGKDHEKEPGELRMALRTPGIDDDLLEGKQAIDCLDLVGHGLSGGGFRLGDISIIKNNILDASFQAILDNLLPREATIRLLGCMTGEGPIGLKMLRATSCALNKRKVLGTTTVINSGHFDADGLKPGYKYFATSRDLEPSREFASLPMPTPKSAHSHWLDALPKGYVLLGTGHPLAEAGPPMFHAGKRISVACDGHLVMIEYLPGMPPLLFQWGKNTSVPAWEFSKQQLA